MSYLPNQYDDMDRKAYMRMLESQDPSSYWRLKLEVDQLRGRLRAIRELFLRYEIPPSFADQREAYQEMRKLILEGGDVT